MHPRTHLRIFRAHALGAALVLACAPGLRAEQMVVVPDTASKDGAFVVRLTHDRAKETDEPDDDAPDVQIVAKAGNKVLASFAFPADPSSDLQPLRTKVHAHWNADSTAVALSFSERFYSYLVVYRLQGTAAKPEAFTEVKLPDTRAVIEPLVPRFKEFRSRWHVEFQDWPKPNVIRFSAGTGAIITPLADEDPYFWAVYSFTMDITDPKTPIIERVEHDHEGE